MWSEWSVQLYHRCDSHGEESLITRNEPRERLVSCPRTGADGGEAGKNAQFAYAPTGGSL